MFLARFNLVKYFPHRRLHKHIYKMNQAYVRHLPDEEKFEVSFQYADPSARINRQFNFSRQASETINTFTQRVATNVEKVLKKKTKNQSLTVQVAVSVNGNVVSDEAVSCKDVFSVSDKNVMLNVCGQEYKVIINSPWITGLALPASILAGFPVYPTKFESMYTDKNLSKFQWFKSSDKKEWSCVGEGFIYNTRNSDIGNFLKLECVPKNEDVQGPAAEAISSVTVEAGPGFCPFETRQQFTQEKCQGDTFRVVSYNILADLYCDSDFTRQALHPYCPPYALAIDYRKQLFIKEITGYNADIICLQEVDRKVYIHDLQPLFKQLNYDSDFCVKGGQVVEGVACFFDKKRFKLLESFRLVLSDELDINPLFLDFWEKIQENGQLAERILDRSTALQVTVLAALDKDEILVVGNTHLYFHPDADHIRLFQGAIIIRYLGRVVEDFKAKFQKRVSLILCGDFNTVPRCGIYKLYTTGSVPEDHIDFQSKPDEAVKMDLQQSLLLRSTATPQYTNFTAGFAECLDYIFYEAQNFKVVQVVPFPTLEELTRHTALPSIVFPSDHIAVISDLKWT